MFIKAIVLTPCQSRNAGVFKGSLSYKEIGTKYFDFSVMCLRLFIFTTRCSLLGTKGEKLPIS